MKLVVEICPLSSAPSRKEAKESPVSEGGKGVARVGREEAGLAAAVCQGRRECGFRPGEVHFATRKRHLKEGELEGLYLSAKLERMSSPGNGYVLDKVPDVTVFLRRQPVVSANLAVLPHSELRKAAVQSGGGVETADTHCFEFVRLGVGLSARGHQATEGNVRFRNERRRPDTGKANLCITAEVLFAAAIEIAAIERALKWRHVGLSGIGPTDTAEEAV